MRTALDQLQDAIVKLRFAIGDLERERGWAASAPAAPAQHAGQLQATWARVATAKEAVFALLAQIEAQMRADLQVKDHYGTRP